MSALETIEAAIVRLEELNEDDRSIINGWLVECVNQCTCAGGTAESNYAHERQCGYEPLTNDPLVVTLHRTITAQLAILRSGVARGIAKVEHGGIERVVWSHERDALALANAILGVAA